MVSAENNTQAIRCSPTHFLQLHRLKPDVTLHVHRKKKKKKSVDYPDALDRLSFWCSCSHNSMTCLEPSEHQHDDVVWWFKVNMREICETVGETKLHIAVQHKADTETVKV